MREFLFRGLDIKGKWHVGLLANPKYDSRNKAVKKDTFYISNSMGSPFAYEVIEKTIGMFTGLLDCENFRIFEGDIVEIDEKHKMTVKWNGMGDWFVDKDGEYFVFTPEIYHLKIIGNIYKDLI